MKKLPGNSRKDSKQGSFLHSQRALKQDFQGKCNTLENK